MNDRQQNHKQTNVRLQDIADRCGLALGTVSMALRGDKRITENTAKLVHETAQEMGYDPFRNTTARRLASSRYATPVLNHIVGFFFAHQSDFSMTNYFFRVTQGVLHAAALSDFEILTSSWSPVDVDPPVIKIAHPYRGGEVDGAIVLEQANFLRLLLPALRDEPNFGNRPVVGLVDHYDGISGVFADHHRSGYLVMSHLLDLGHRKVLGYRKPAQGGDTTVFGERWRGYQTACNDRGVNPEEVLISMRWHPADPDRAEALLNMIHNRGVTAVIAISDYDAVVAHRELTANGLAIPDDISLISYDDTDPIPGRNGENTLTSIRLPLTEIGFEGTRLALRRVLGEETADKDIIMPVDLILRASTAPPTTKRR